VPPVTVRIFPALPIQSPPELACVIFHQTIFLFISPINIANVRNIEKVTTIKIKISHPFLLEFILDSFLHFPDNFS
jgi:hypothetical protein